MTHLAQVAAQADHQIAVRKAEVDGRTSLRGHRPRTRRRVVELSRMLSGRPDSETARRHAEELLGSAASGPLGTRADRRADGGPTRRPSAEPRQLLAMDAARSATARGSRTQTGGPGP